MAYLEIQKKYLGLVYMGIVLPAIVDRITTSYYIHLCCELNRNYRLSIRNLLIIKHPLGHLTVIPIRKAIIALHISAT